MPRIQAATVAEHRALQRRAILNAARDLLAEDGAQAPSLAVVAKRTGLARSSIYQYFKSKNDLLDALIADLFPKWSAYVLGRMAEARTPGDRALTYVDANLHLVAIGEHAIVRGLAAAAQTETIVERSRVLFEELRVPLVAALTERGASNPEAMADLIQAIVHRASSMIENGAPEAEARTLTRELLAPYLGCDPA